jgi:GDPmannose 4,6-dehydratase
MKKAIITGIAGQDGAFLAKLLVDKGYRVIGADRRRVDTDYWRLKELGVFEKIQIIYFDLLEESRIHQVIREIKPDEFYNLGAQSFVKASWELPVLTSKVNTSGVLTILEAIRLWSPDTRLYQASTSEMFGMIQDEIQTESTKFYPRSPYGVSKLAAHWYCVNYRESYNLFVSSGILFNHESELRGAEFVTKKITKYVGDYAKGLTSETLKLGNLSAERDWGFAGDYVYGMWLILQNNNPDDFVLSTGYKHSVREFLIEAFKIIDIELFFDGSGINEKVYDKKNMKLLVEVKEEFFRPAEVDVLIGNYKKAKEILNWSPKVTFKELVCRMMNFELKK